MACTWPKGNCECSMQEQTKPDRFGRVWMHCNSGLSMSKASLARFMQFCLTENVELGDIHAFAPKYPRSTVIAAVRLKPEQFDIFQQETGGKLSKPPVIKLN